MPFDDLAADVLGFWFAKLRPAQWWRTDDSVDEAIRARFSGLHETLSAGVEAAWLEAPERALAALIVLDQFSRNLFRGDARAFAHDEAARGLAEVMIARGFDRALEPQQRAFVYMPFMHSEALADQDRAIALFDALGLADQVRHAAEHRAVIVRFGRFPTRNAALGRANTPEEAVYLMNQSGAV